MANARIVEDVGGSRVGATHRIGRGEIQKAAMVATMHRLAYPLDTLLRAKISSGSPTALPSSEDRGMSASNS